MLWLNKRNLTFLLLLAGAFYASIQGTEIDLSKFTRIANMISFLREKWWPPDWEVFPLAIRESLITLEIAFLGTFVALLAAFPLSFLAAKNTSPPALYNAMRGVLSFLRSVPEIVFGLVFVTVVGLGPFPAILAIILHNVGVLGKLISELVEAAEKGPQEALLAVGAKPAFVSLYGIVPQILPNVLSHYFYRLEVAVRTSLILGFIGAGGVGQQLFIHFKLFQYDKVTVDVLMIMALVVIIDYTSSFVRSRII
ncbi:phosphonate ABC transporter, permease protein PhnE [Bacillaceae bacterium]